MIFFIVYATTSPRLVLIQDQAMLAREPNRPNIFIVIIQATKYWRPILTKVETELQYYHADTKIWTHVRYPNLFNLDYTYLNAMYPDYKCKMLM